MYRFYFLVVLTLCFFSISAQITTNPELPVATQKVTIIFDSSKESRLGYYTGDLYAHTGVLIEGKTDWQHVIGDWGENDKQPKLTYKQNGIYELEITPDINSFYGVGSGEKVTKIAFVFRSTDANKQTDDLFVNVYEEGLVVQIAEPENNTILKINQSATISANTSIASALKLKVNETLLFETSGTSISTNHSFTESGEYWVIAEAEANGETVLDSLLVFVRDEVITETKPEVYKKGINYPTDNSAALVLWAPNKEFVFVLGDFNHWKPTNEYQMKKDGDYFWLEIENLETGKEYIFQYLIDGEIKIADPYTEKTVDPSHDEYIPEEVYPDLISYPEGKTEGIASVLQSGQEYYNWEVTDFQMPDKERLVIYELLIRDFTEEHTYKSIVEKLDYLEDLRVNVLELMPVNEFEGNSSWGYNPSFYFAPDKYYGPKNELKKLIDECHKRDIAVVIDMVLNHSYGQSPFVQMYMDNWTILPENPWYNVESPNPVFSWGYDFNHESDAVKELVDSVNSFWMNEYKVDGFRFDFTKGFTNTPGDGSAYDQPRINILKRMADEIWKRNPEALVILEHLAGNTEETILADYGMLLWGNMNHNYGEAAMGYTANSNLNWGLYSSRGWSEPNLVTYMESHDEERLTYKCLNFGHSAGDYDTKELSVATDRLELNSVFLIPLPGPKMIWQFGELGYDYSINTCEDGTTIDDDCRTSPKPIRWDYLDNIDRTDVFQVMAKLNELKQSYDEFTPDAAEYSLNGATKWYRLSNGSHHVLTIGNFDVVDQSLDITFPTNGKWYEFFSKDSIEISSTSQNFALNPGEYRMYSTRKFDDPDVITEIDEISDVKSNISIYPNPATNEINISSGEFISTIQIYSTDGKLMYQSGLVSEKSKKISVKGFKPGIYFFKVIQNEKVSTKKIIVN